MILLFLLHLHLIQLQQYLMIHFQKLTQLLWREPTDGRQEKAKTLGGTVHTGSVVVQAGEGSAS